jgi:nitric oxide reductase subunit C
MRSDRLEGLEAPIPGDPVRRVVVRTGLMIGAYAGYAALVLALSASPIEGPADGRFARAEQGRRVWLSRGCVACHSIYGLGGHTGPDLTNVARRVPPESIAHAVQNGRPGMPASRVTPEEVAALVEYLASVDATGVYPPRGIGSPVFGERP